MRRCARGRLERAGVVRVRQQVFFTVNAPEDPLDLAVSGLAEQQHDMPGVGERRAAFLHLSDQRACGVNDIQRQRTCARLDLFGHAVRAEDERGFLLWYFFRHLQVRLWQY